MDLDSNSLKIFEAALKVGSFSGAAKTLKISQPSVSQMIARLEDKLGNRLFERVGHAIVPTKLAQELHNFASNWLESLDAFRDRLHEETAAPSGTVRFAKPESFLWTSHYRTILKQLSELKEIRIDISIETTEAIVEGVLADKCDFGFIVGEKISPDLKFERFSDEHYVAVQAKSLTERPHFDGKSRIRMVTYPGWERYFAIWSSHHGVSKRVKTSQIIPVVNVGSIAGAIEAVHQGAGVAILPQQCAAVGIQNRGTIMVDPSSGDKASAPVYLVRRRGYSEPARVKLVLEKLRSC